MKTLLGQYPWALAIMNVAEAALIILLTNPWVLAGLAGLSFGMWPHTLPKSGLVGFNTPTAFTMVQGVFLLMITLGWWMYVGGKDWKTVIPITMALIFAMGYFTQWKWSEGTRWNFLLASAFLNGFGMLCISRMLELATNDNRSVLLTMVNVVSVGVMATVQIMLHSQSFRVTQLIPYASAALTIYLFMRLR